MTCQNATYLIFLSHVKFVYAAIDPIRFHKMLASIVPTLNHSSRLSFK